MQVGMIPLARNQWVCCRVAVDPAQGADVNETVRGVEGIPPRTGSVKLDEALFPRLAIAAGSLQPGGAVALKAVFAQQIALSPNYVAPPEVHLLKEADGAVGEERA